MQQYSVADLARHLKHAAIYCRDVYLDVRVLDGAWIEEGRHEVEGIEFALEIQLRPVLPAIPYGPQGQDILPHALGRASPGHVEAPYDMPTNLAAQAQLEPAFGQIL